MRGWNEKKVQQLKNQGKIRGYVLQKPRVKRRTEPVQKRSKEKSWIHWNLQYWCNSNALQLATEYKFHPDRGWRFDYAIPALKIAVEYEGLMSEKSRHTTISGFTADTGKYNAANKLGWKVYRYTVLNYRNLINDLKECIKTAC
jgi:hypothetical protein